MPELQTAIDAGLLENDELEVDPIALMTDAALRASGRAATEGSTDAALTAMVARMASAMAPGLLTYPMLAMERTGWPVP